MTERDEKCPEFLLVFSALVVTFTCYLSPNKGLIFLVLVSSFQDHGILW